jgi:hypothetical protein
MIVGLNVDIPDAAEKPMRHQPALDFMPDLAKTRVEYLADLLIFHETLLRP